MRASGADLGLRVVEAESLYDRFVTAVDDAAEAAILNVLRDAGSDRTWVIDAIDGTTNLVLGDPYVGVTLALVERGEPLVAATGCPFTGEIWSAALGCGAFDFEGRRLGLSHRPPESRRIALDPASPPPPQRAVWESARDRIAETFAEVVLRASIALALAHVASGEFDGFVQIGGSPVEDFAAGTLLVREAGGLVTGLDGQAAPWGASVVIAGPPRTHRELQQALSGVSLRDDGSSPSR